MTGGNKIPKKAKKMAEKNFFYFQLPIFSQRHFPRKEHNKKIFIFELMI